MHPAIVESKLACSNYPCEMCPMGLNEIALWSCCLDGTVSQLPALNIQENLDIREASVKVQTGEEKHNFRQETTLLALKSLSLSASFELKQKFHFSTLPMGSTNTYH